MFKKSAILYEMQKNQKFFCRINLKIILNQWILFCIHIQGDVTTDWNEITLNYLVQNQFAEISVFHIPFIMCAYVESQVSVRFKKYKSVTMILDF
jgi:hypothetical protein